MRQVIERRLPAGEHRVMIGDMAETSTPGPSARSSLANRAAVEYVRAQAERNQYRDERRIRTVFRNAGMTADVDLLCDGLRRLATLTVNFHPDRIAVDGRSVAEALLSDGLYRNQFETGISSGGLTAYPGGDRDQWEARLFGGAYQAPDVSAAERPRYGGLDLLGLANGACPRFGSCHLRLNPECLNRATFFVGDSVDLPDDGGVLYRLEPVLAGLLERVAMGDELGRPLTVALLVDMLLDPERQPSASVMSHALDAFLEAQVHGQIALADDVTAIVIDPSFRGSPTGDMLLEAGRRHGVGIGWNAGSRLPIEEIPTEEPATPAPRRWAEFCADGRAAEFARSVADRFAAGGRHIDAATLGRAAVSVVREPRVWEPWGDTEDPLTRLKDLWHILVVYGRAVEATDDSAGLHP